MKKYRLVIAEDHGVLRDGLKSLLESTDRYEVVAEADNGLEAIRCVEKLSPDLIILDISMPKLSGLSVLHDLKSRYPEVKIILLTVHDSEEYLAEAFRKGAEGFCLKKGPFEDLLSAIESVLVKGKPYVSPFMLRPLLDGYLKKSDPEFNRSGWELLTHREKDVLKLVGEGYKNKEIADLLCISPKTVEKHRANLMQKLDIHNASALTAYAIKQGLVIPQA